MNLSYKLIRRNFFTKLKNIFQNEIPKSIILFDPENISNDWKDDWIATSDKGYGGPSIAELSIEGLQSNEGYDKFLRFQGSMNMTKQGAKSLGVVSGFCAFRGELISSQDLDDYKGIEIICKSGIDTSIVLNMTLNNRTDEDVYQSRLTLTKSDTWKKYHIPFTSFRLTLFGRVRQGQSDFSDSSIESFGMLIRHHNGPFRIDIQSIKILTELDSEFSSESEYKRPNFHRIGAHSVSNSRVPEKILPIELNNETSSTILSTTSEESSESSSKPSS